MEKKAFTKGSGSTFEDIEENEDILKDIDPKIRPLIKLCMSKNLRTFASCEGHPEKDPDGLGYIAFETIDDPRAINMAAWFIKRFGKESIDIAFANSLKGIGMKKVSQCQLSLGWRSSLKEIVIPEMFQIIENGYIDRKPEQPLPHWFELMKKISMESSARNISTQLSKNINFGEMWGAFNFSCDENDKDVLRRIVEIGEEFKRSGIASFERPNGPKAPEQVLEPWGYGALGVSIILDKVPDKKVCKSLERTQKILSNEKNKGKVTNFER